MKLINTSNEEWLALFEKSLLHKETGVSHFSAICSVQYAHYITVWPKCHIFAWCVCLRIP